jgi:hypothetical protein
MNYKPRNCKLTVREHYDIYPRLRLDRIKTRDLSAAWFLRLRRSPGGAALSEAPRALTL